MNQQANQYLKAILAAKIQRNPVYVPPTKQ